MLNIEAFVEQRYPDFYQRHRRLGPTLVALLRVLMHEQRFQRFGRDYPHLEGFDFVEEVLRHFDFGYRVADRDRERIPAHGRIVIIANHPIGSLDGLALLKLIREVRPDVKVVANDLLMAIEPLRALLLPVDNMGGNTSRRNLQAIRRHLDADGALIIFPAGKVSRLGPGGIADDRWSRGFVRIARIASAPILPIHVDARNSLLFYALSILAQPLSTLWLVREMFKHANKTVDVRIGNPVLQKQWDQRDADDDTIAGKFRKHVYRIGRGRKPVFPTLAAVAHPENRQLLRREIEACESLGATPDGKKILLYRYRTGDCLMREIGRLRELTFRAVGEGSGMPRDIDRHDRDYFHLLLWDDRDLELVGAYRVGEAGALVAGRGLDALYTHSLFEFDDQMRPFIEQGLELGRSFVQPRYQGLRALDYLWYGIGAFVSRYPQYRYLFGPVSISRDYGTAATSALVWFYSVWFGASYPLVRGRNAFEVDRELSDRFADMFPGRDYSREFERLKDYLAERDLRVPMLYKQYTDVCEPQGVRILGFNRDARFGDCVDGFLLVDLDHLKPRKRRRYVPTKGEDDDGDAMAA